MTLPGISIPPNVAILQDYTEAYPVDQIRLYDVAIEKWVNSFVHPKGIGSLFVVIATPERGYAEQKQITNKDVLETVKRRDKTLNQTMPTVSITQKNITKDMTRWKRSNIPKAGFVDSNNKEEIYQFPYPKPILINYSLEFESINRTTHNYLRQFFHLQFDDIAFYLPIDFSSVHEHYPCYDIRWEQTSLEDTSDLETQDNQRNLRFVLDITAIGWYFLPMRKMKTVLKSKFTICDDNGLLEEISIPN